MNKSYKARYRAMKIAQGMCACCAARPPIENKRFCQKCLDRSSRNGKKYRKKFKYKVNKYIKAWRKKNPETNKKIFNKHFNKLRNEVMSHYVKTCQCGSNENLNLEIHGEFRKAIPKGTDYAFLKWVKKNKYPNYIIVLCRKCNLLYRNMHNKEKQHQYHLNNIDSLKVKKKSYYWNLKVKALNHFGGSCVGCKCIEIAVLTFDHINDDGNIKRKQSKYESGVPLFIRLCQEPKRQDIQILCGNCQMRKRIYGKHIEHWFDKRLKLESVVKPLETHNEKDLHLPRGPA